MNNEKLTREEIAKKMYKDCVGSPYFFCVGNHGFSIDFGEGNYRISVQFGPGNYCDNRYGYDIDEPKNQFFWRYRNAEVAVLYDEEFVTKEILQEVGIKGAVDDVYANATPAQVAQVISYLYQKMAAAAKKETEEEEERVCDCFVVREEEVECSDFMKGYMFAKTREKLPDTYTEERYSCIGAGPEEEPCHCYGKKSQCDFYWPNGKSKLLFNEDGSKKYK